MRSILCLLLSLLVFSACMKMGGLNEKPVSSVTVVNGVVGSTAFVPDFSTDSVRWYASAESIGYGASYEYGVTSGNVPISIVQVTDTNLVSNLGSLRLLPYGNYSLFVMGQLDQAGHGALDMLITKDTIPSYTTSDSAIGVRFVNVVIGGNAVSVNQQGMPGGSEVANLGYKGVTGFKTYSENAAISGYTFEVRDAVTDSLLTSYSIGNLPLGKNVTIVVFGLNEVGNPSGSVNSALIDNY